MDKPHRLKQAGDRMGAAAIARDPKQMAEALLLLAEGMYAANLLDQELTPMIVTAQAGEVRQTFVEGDEPMLALRLLGGRAFAAGASLRRLPASGLHHPELLA
jgi:hypothetical protein